MRIFTVTSIAVTLCAASASAEGVARGALNGAMLPYICTDDATKESEPVVFFKQHDSDGYILLPHAATAALNGSVFTSINERGTYTMNGTRFVLVTEDEVETGTCVPISNTIDQMVRMIESTSPDAFDQLAANYMAPWAEKRAEIEAKAEVAKFAAEAEAKAKAGYAVASENERLKRENDKLKKRICELDPEATFSACAKK